MSLRTEQLDEYIAREISEFFSREVEFPLECLVTVTRAKVTSDLKYAQVWLSVLPEKFTPQAMKIAIRSLREFEKKLFKKMSTKFVPKITFKIDTGEARAAVVENLINQVKNEPTDNQ
jgi:ribosome-binding factor A